MTVLASGVILYRRQPDGPRVLLLRNRDNGHWGLPKGRRDADDDHEVQTALREVAEETGYTGLDLDPTFRHPVEYVVKGTADHGRRKRVTYFLAEAPGPAPTLSPEHDAFLWVDAGRAREVLAYGQLQDLVEHALRHVAAAGPDPRAC